MPDVDQDGVDASEDCDDYDARSYPGAVEVCDQVDNDCDGAIDEGVLTLYHTDHDGDGFGAGEGVSACAPAFDQTEVGGDCDDNDPEVNPAATEVCNGLDDNCSGEADEGVTVVLYPDQDGDGFGNEELETLCPGTPGYAEINGDCDDGDSLVYPDAVELCDGIDNDCDDQLDEEGQSLYYRDGDGDGFGTGEGQPACSALPGFAPVNGDCDDSNGQVHPQADEVCDGVDNNCDGSVDEGVKTTYYLDNDGDGYGQTAATATGCTRPAGYASSANDCNDNAATIYPGAAEACNKKDDDCDGNIDEGLLGSGSSCPASSCMAIHTAQPTSPSGVYWLKPITSASAVKYTCDMTGNGGGWTILFDWKPDQGLSAWDNFWGEVLYNNFVTREVRSDCADGFVEPTDPTINGSFPCLNVRDSKDTYVGYAAAHHVEIQNGGELRLISDQFFDSYDESGWWIVAEAGNIDELVNIRCLDTKAEKWNGYTDEEVALMPLGGCPDYNQKIYHLDYWIQETRTVAYPPYLDYLHWRMFMAGPNDAHLIRAVSIAVR